MLHDGHGAGISPTHLLRVGAPCIGSDQVMCLYLIPFRMPAWFQQIDMALH